MINSNLGPILHRLTTIHPLQRTTDDDGRQPCKTPTALLSSAALWLEPAFPAWRNHTGWSVTTASGLTVWHCCHGTLGAAPLGTSQWSTLWETLICSRVPSPVPVPLRLQLSEKRNKYSSLSGTHDFLRAKTECFARLCHRLGVCLSVRPSVRPSVCHTRDLYQNGAS